MATSATQTEKLQYTPPGGTTQTITRAVAGSHVARSSGTIAIPINTADATAKALPSGPYKKLVIQNRTNGQNILVTLNGTAVLQLPAGGEFSFAFPAAPSSVPVNSASISNVGLQLTDAEVDYFIFD